jgi:hypothetical protein
MTMRKRFALILGLALMNGCGGVLHRSDTAARVDFAYEMEGKTHLLSELRRRPVMLVLMRISEIVSQIFMKEVTTVYQKRAGELRVIVLTVEPMEKPFVDVYVESEKLPFSIGVAEPAVLLGASSMGVIEAVPVTYLLEPGGRIAYKAQGVTPADILVSEIDELLDF